MNENPQVQTLKQRLEQATETLQKAQEALAVITHQIEQAQPGRQTRLLALQKHEERALQVAQDHLTVGRQKVTPKERAADDLAERLRRELARADQILGNLTEAQTKAAQEVQDASRVLELYRVDLDKALAAAEAATLHERVRALAEELREVCAEGRKHNRQVAELMRRQAQITGRGSIGESTARLSGVDVLFLPGALLPNPIIQRDLASISQAGFTMQFTRDLEFAETDEWAATQRPL